MALDFHRLDNDEHLFGLEDAKYNNLLEISKNIHCNCSYYGYNCRMKTVGVRALKDNLSSFLRMVNDGEIILVSDHNKIIAELKKPSINYSQKNMKISKYIEDGEKIGTVEKATKKASTLKHPSSLKERFKLDWMKIYYSDRD